MRFHPSSAFLRTLLVLTGTSALFLTGCANMVTTASEQNSFTKPGVMTGKIYGGQTPISGALVTLSTVGTTGYGSAGTVLATTSTLSDGSFSFTQSAPGTATSGSTYGCPTSGDPQLYLVATGGNTQGTGTTTNSAAAAIAVIGKCSTAASAIANMNEVITTGTMAAVQQYFSPVTETIGSPSSAQATLGLTNAIANVANLVNTAAGTVNGDTKTGASTLTLTATPTGSTTAANVVVTVEAFKINTIADITAACINGVDQTNSNCGTLFANATPPAPAVTSQPNATFATATDVLQATYYMMTNPTSGSAAHINALFVLATPSSPFQGTLTAAPTDWTIGMLFSSASTCTYGTFLTAPYDVAVDAGGNLWVASGGTSSTSANLIELTPNGTPAVCTLGNSVAAAKALTIDTSGNIWIAGNAANSPFYRYKPGTGPTTFAVPTGSVPYSVAADASGDIFYTDIVNKVVDKFTGVATAATATALPVGAVNTNALFLAIDTSGNVIVTNSTTGATSVLYDIYPSTGTGNTNGYLTSTLSTTGIVNPYALAAGLNGVIWAGNSANSGNTNASTAYYLTPGAGGTATFSSNTAQYAGGIGSPRGPAAVDGAGNVWYANSLASVGNYVTGTTTGGGLYSLSEFSASEVALSPSSTSTTGNNAGFEKPATIFTSAPRSVAIDPSGNVWVGSNSASGNGVVQFVGAAVPVVTPVSAGLAAGVTTKNAVQMP